MTRKKKSRKSGPLAPSNKPIAFIREQRRASDDDKKPKKKTGLKSGSRNSQLTKAKEQDVKQNGPKDARHGSKKPIVLLPELAAKQVNPVEQTVADLKPSAKLVKAKVPTLSPELELEQIEQDEQLAALLERVDNGEILQGKEAKYFNAKVKRHQELVTLLGLDDEYDEDDDEPEQDDPLARMMQQDWRKDLGYEEDDK